MQIVHTAIEYLIAHITRMRARTHHRSTWRARAHTRALVIAVITPALGAIYVRLCAVANKPRTVPTRPKLFALRCTHKNM